MNGVDQAQQRSPWGWTGAAAALGTTQPAAAHGVDSADSATILLDRHAPMYTQPHCAKSTHLERDERLHVCSVRRLAISRRTNEPNTHREFSAGESQTQEFVRLHARDMACGGDEKINSIAESISSEYLGERERNAARAARLGGGARRSGWTRSTGLQMMIGVMVAVMHGSPVISRCAGGTRIAAGNRCERLQQAACEAVHVCGRQRRDVRGSGRATRGDMGACDVYLVCSHSASEIDMEGRMYARDTSPGHACTNIWAHRWQAVQGEHTQVETSNNARDDGGGAGWWVWGGYSEQREGTAR